MEQSDIVDATLLLTNVINKLYQQQTSPGEASGVKRYEIGKDSSTIICMDRVVVGYTHSARSFSLSNCSKDSAIYRKLKMLFEYDGERFKLDSYAGQSIIEHPLLIEERLPGPYSLP